MLAGTIQLEDLVITYKVNMQQHGEDRVVYTVCDPVTGKEETVDCPAKEFMVALGAALNYNGDAHSSVPYADLERLQPEDPDLRFIP